MPATGTITNAKTRADQRAKLFSLFGQSKTQEHCPRDCALPDEVAATLQTAANNSFNTRPKLPFVARVFLRTAAKTGGYHKFL
jgi:hypothetical protein